MNKPLVSVLIPVYNAALYLDECLKSIENQTYNNIEIICVDDGSTDESSSILTRFSQTGHFLTVIHQQNHGQCAASNVALANANGDYIKFFDADDIMNPEHIQSQIAKLNGRNDCIASCEWGRFYDNNPNSAKFKPEENWQDLKTINWLKIALGQKNDMMGAWLWLIPRKIIEKAGGWDERLSLNNDFEFSVRLLLHAKEVLFTKEAKIYYRSGLPSSLSSIYSVKSLEEAMLATDLGCSYLLTIENTFQMKRLCANRYQEWAYRIYPNHINLIKKIETQINELGGSDKKMEGGSVFIILRTLVGWKKAKRVQLFFYKLGYLKLLKWMQ